MYANTPSNFCKWNIFVFAKWMDIKDIFMCLEMKTEINFLLHHHHVVIQMVHYPNGESDDDEQKGKGGNENP